MNAEFEFNIPADTAMVRTEDGRVFVDIESWVGSMHTAHHMVSALTELFHSTDYVDGQHHAIMSMFDAVDMMRSELDLPPLEKAGPDTDGQAEVDDLETAFAMDAPDDIPESER